MKQCSGRSKRSVAKQNDEVFACRQVRNMRLEQFRIASGGAIFSVRICATDL